MDDYGEEDDMEGEEGEMDEEEIMRRMAEMQAMGYDPQQLMAMQGM